ncbi:hypothetical protein Peur_016301 [Populus x canadensis]|uniref:senescence-specific cysteine protease SAG12-like n=1 Tax=Populus nigra TaxID=3691 RepID=UPI002B264ACA|nr:senescence-specific cysteine protease SAG12-like [Populus nigra]XP_061978303.1 senescence-specific cysteine protease SAG12-like [Populus nigra]
MAAKKCTTRIFLPFLLILAAWATKIACRPLDEQEYMLKRHEEWMAQHGRVYGDMKEKEKRYLIFKENVERIEAFNNGSDRGYKLGVNKFADLTNEEFRAMYHGYKRQSSKLMSSSFRYENLSDIPTSMDWRNDGAVTPVKDQGTCGCCWAFSTVAAIEGIIKLQTGNLISLSEQQLVDCTAGNNGCQGGVMDTAFRYIIRNGGLTSEDNYPYQGVDGTCNSEEAASTEAQITGYEDVPKNNENALLQAVAKQPVSVAVDGGGNDFRFYKSGVFEGDCGTDLNHAVTAIGYGTDSDGTDYWLVKNSWGTSWGDSGYMKMRRGIGSSEGLCGVAMDASYPTA